MFSSIENKLKVSIVTVLVISLSIIFIFHRIALKNRFEEESEQLLYQLGKDYEYEIKSEFTKLSSISDLLARSIAKNYNNTEFNSELRNILRDVIYRNTRLQSIELMIKEPEKAKDSLHLLISLNDSLKQRSVKLVKLKSGIIEDVQIKEFSSTTTKVAVEKALILDQTKILPPEIIQSDGQPNTIVPILSTIYKGKQFLGYIILSVSVNWMAQIQTERESVADFSEVFVSSPDGKVIELNKSKELISEPVQKVCLSCQNLLGNKGQRYNSDIQDYYITTCIPWQPVADAEYWNICLRAPLNKISSVLNYHSVYSWALLIFVVIAASFFMIFFLTRYIHLWGNLEILLKNIMKGDSVSIGNESKPDGISIVSGFRNTLIEVAKSLDVLVQLNKVAIKGEIDDKLEQELGEHPAFRSTVAMHRNYKANIDKLESENASLAQMKQLTNGLDSINKVLKHYHHDLEQLSIHVIHTLVDLLEIEMGAVFLTKTDKDSTYLELIVSYAYSEDRFQKRVFKYGESLVGACAAEKRTIFMKKVPDDYLKIISGLGLASPKSILIVPLIFEGEVLGVIELGTLKEFDDNQIFFAEKSAETIANTLSLAEINIKTSELLQKTKEQTIELEKRDKRMLEALDELKQLQLKTANSENAIRAKLEAMNNTLMMVEYSSRGILIDANYKYLNTMNYAIEDIKGIDVLELLKEEDRPELIKIINIVKNGNFFEGIMRRPTRQGVEKWLMATYTPVFNDQNIVESILFFAIDVTRLRKNEEMLKQNVKELLSQVDDLRAQLKRSRE